MLTVTPSGLDTAAERAFFSELTSWDSGGAVRGALVASLPLSDGPMERRISDAVVFVPEGLAVVRVVEVVRQSGVVTVLPEGAWTIAPDSGPGDVLRLAGGGSTTLDGLMRAGMAAAVRLRRVGLEPGRIARLTVLAGELTGLVPADGDLGEGDQVSLLDPRSMLLGISRASRYAGTDNPRLWTTADVRAALDALGVGGRSPSVEELNGEGFPYSPYVLRRRELLAPATLASQPAVRSAAPTAGPTSPSPATGPGSSGAPVGSPDGPLVDRAAAAALAASAVDAQDRAADRPAAAGVPTRDTVALLGRPEEAEPAGHRDTQQIVPTRRVTEHQEQQPEARSVDETGGIGGLFSPGRDRGASAGREREASHPEQAPQEWVPQPTWSSRAPVDERPAEPKRRRGLLVVLGALALVIVLGVGGFLLISHRDDADNSATAEPSQVTQTTASAAPATTEPAAPTGLPIGTTQVVAGTTYTLQAFAHDESCVDHGYGAVSGFFGASDCSGLSRSLWSADAAGAPAVVSLAQVTMPDPARAQALVALTTTSGTGNVNDLLREGVRYAGGPDRLAGDREYASSVRDDVAIIVETDWVGDSADPGALAALAQNALELDATG